MSKLGFSGTQGKLTIHQATELTRIICDDPSITEIHHGDCIGADAFVHGIALLADKKIVIHPPDIPKKRAWCSGSADQVTILKPKPYLIRNHDIVDDTDELLTAPGSLEIIRSGTWATIRYAKSIKRKITIIMPESE